MVEITPVAKKITPTSATVYFEDKTGNFDTTGIDVDDDSYDTGSFIDRDYDIRNARSVSIALENLGPNSVDYTIVATTRDFDDLDTDIEDDDYTEVIKANTAIAAGSQATGSVEITGGPSTAADGTLTLVSATALVASIGTVTMASPVANTFADGDITMAAVEAADTVAINGLLYTAVDGVKSDNTEFRRDDASGGGVDDNAAIDLADSINNDVRSGTSGDTTATSSGDVTTAITDVTGTGGNAITLVSSNGTRLAVTGSGNFTGGVTADIVTANGLIYTAVVGARSDDTEFSIDGTDTDSAVDLAAAITADVRAGTLNDITATNTTVVVDMVQTVAGVGGNATTLTSSDGTRLAVSGAVFTGGTDADTATVNGLLYTAVTGAKSNDTEFNISGGDNAAATDLADSIDDDTRTGITVPSIDVTATAGTNVVTVLAPLNSGAAANAIDISGTANITADNAVLTGGITSFLTQILVGDVIITNATINWRTSDTLTADDVAANINAFDTNPNYTAVNAAGVITLTRVHNGPSTETVTSTTTVMTKTDVNMSGGVTGYSTPDNLQQLTPVHTAIRIRAKETAVGDPGKIRGDVKIRRSL